MVVIEQLGPEQVGELGPALHDLYRWCFTEPPWNESAAQVADFPHTLATQLAQPGLFAVIARDGAMLIGAAYGWMSPASMPVDAFHRAVVRQVPASVCQELLAPAVVLTELMVHPSHRGRGLGRTLLDRYVADHPCAWLCTHPQAPACGLYEAAGWWPRALFTNQLGDPRVLYTWTRHETPGPAWHGLTLRFPGSAGPGTTSVARTGPTNRSEPRRTGFRHRSS